MPLRLRRRAGGAEQLEVPERSPEAAERPKQQHRHLVEEWVEEQTKSQVSLLKPTIASRWEVCHTTSLPHQAVH